ncbi:MAG: DNA polymerase III subunit delta [Clostridia bacterium]|nr:DNA polymerase III subunit delta [Clostridia bacterium]
MKFAELKKRVLGGEIKPFYQLTGDDEYLKSSARKILAGRIFMPELNVVSLENPTSSQLRDALSAMPMMSDRRLVIVDNISEVSAVQDLEWGSTILLLTHQATKKKTKPTKASKSQTNEDAVGAFLVRAEEVDCSPMDESIIFNWLAVEAKKNEVTIDVESARLLCEYCRNYMSRISTEFAKLASYRMGGVITVEDVKKLVTPDTEYAVWQLSGAIASGNGKKAMEIYGGMNEDAKKPEVLLANLQSHFRKLFYSLTEAEEKLTKNLMRSNALFAVKREAKRFGASRLAGILRSLGQTDEDVKSSVLPREVASETMISRILSEV